MHHAALAAAVTLVFGLAFGWWAEAAAFSCGWFISREVACAEYRWIQEFGERRRANMPIWGGFDPRVWDRKSLIDWIAPVVVSIFIAWIASQ